MGARGVTIAVSLASVPVLVRYLGPQAYGVWATVSSLVALLNVADLGIGSGLLNAVASARGRDDTQQVRVVVAASVYLYGGAAIFIVAVVLCSFWAVDWGSLFNVGSPDLAKDGRLTALTFGLLFAAGMPLVAAVQVSAAYQQGYIGARYAAVGVVIGFAALIAAVELAAPMWVLALCVGTGTLVGYAFTTFDVFWWRKPFLRPQASFVTRRAVTHLFRAGMLFFILQVAGTLAFSVDNLIGAQVLGPEAVTRYAVPFRLFSAAEGFVVIITTSLWPAYSEAIASGDMPWVRTTLRRAMSGLVLFGILAAALLVITGRSIVRLWVGPSVSVDGGLLLGLGCWLVLASFGHCVAAFLAAAHVIRFQILSAIAMACLNVGLSVILARAMGVAGLIWGTVISYSLCTAVPYAVRLPSVLRRIEESAAR